MKLMRPPRPEDAEGLLDLAQRMGTGMTTFPAHLPTIQRRIEKSIEAFAASHAAPEGQDYLMVMEDLSDKRLVGTSALIAGIGLDQPFYNYRMIHLAQTSTQPMMRVDTALLQLANDYTGCTEVASLFLDPARRGGQAGKLLSKSRYMLLAAFPERFTPRVMAEIRGWVDSDGHSPFWEAVGRHFFGMSFAEADKINGQGNQQFIADLMPKFPLYTALLPDAAQQVIGQPHESAKPAVELLEREGFAFTGAVDIFDAGPALDCARRDIWTVRNSRTGKLAGTIDHHNSGEKPTHLVAVDHLPDYRVTLARLAETDGGLWLPSDAAAVLGVAAGDEIRTCPLLQPADQRSGEAQQPAMARRLS